MVCMWNGQFQTEPARVTDTETGLTRLPIVQLQNRSSFILSVLLIKRSRPAEGVLIWIPIFVS